MTFESEVDGVRWGISQVYPGRAHVVDGPDPTGLCGIPVAQVYSQRPDRPLICPECALAYMRAAFPGTTPHPTAAYPTGPLAPQPSDRPTFPWGGDPR
ncbi:hypothetical protein [Actinokineospora sp.]|uniref:hypothetical protein n=1 Tax=Actinokineospora sp. TaxID=1872133 RepID=UPI004037C284